jgi:hypothetical protein
MKKLFYFLKGRIYDRVITWELKGKWLILGDILFKKYNNKPIILYVSFITGGGLKKHLFELISKVTKHYDIWIVMGNDIIWHNGIKFRTSLDFKDILKKINPDIIHVHQLSRDLHEIYKLPMDKTIVTAHDLYYVCPNFFMMECLNGEFCHPSYCNKEWREKMHYLLKNCRKIVCPSIAVKELLMFYHDDIEENIIVVEHGC